MDFYLDLQARCISKESAKFRVAVTALRMPAAVSREILVLYLVLLPRGQIMITHYLEHIGTPELVVLHCLHHRNVGARLSAELGQDDLENYSANHTNYSVKTILLKLTPQWRLS